MRRFLGVLLTMAWLLAACGGGSTDPGGSGGGGGGGGGGGSDLPAASTVIFGTSFDPGSLGVGGKASTLKAGSPMVAVGRVFAARPSSEVVVEVAKGSNTFPDRPVTAANSTDSADLFAVDLSGDKLTAGTWVVSFKAAGKIVASGFLTVSP